MVCLVLLEDITMTDEDLYKFRLWGQIFFRYNIMPKIRESVWFTRAWTLQELIAPRNVEFFESTGKSIGSKVDL